MLKHLRKVQSASYQESKQNKLTVKVEFESVPNKFGTEEFRVLIEEALKTVHGLAAPICTVHSFDDASLKGSIIFDSKDLHQVWAALSIYGFHFGRNVAIHLNKLAEIEN
uniref:Ribonuclease P n=1 Tax=Steinernema glaseri TaxID=37863 RepID=A0A1I7ZY38_9BILA